MIRKPPADNRSFYVALLRGINLGNRRITMAELREIFESLGMAHVKTYIQTGNVLFESPKKPENSALPKQDAATLTAELTAVLEQGLAGKLGYEVPVILVRPADLRKIVESNPFSAAEMDDDVKRYVAFLPKKLSASQTKQLKALRVKDESYYVGEAVVYAAFRGPTLESAFFGNDLIGKTLGVKPTVRNWKVVTALADLAEQPLD